MPRSAAELFLFGQANLDALAQSGAVLVEGIGALSKEMMDFAVASTAEALTTGQAIAESKTISEAVELHKQAVHTAFDNWTAHGQRLSTLGVEVAKTSWRPLEERTQAIADFWGQVGKD